MVAGMLRVVGVARRGVASSAADSAAAVAKELPRLNIQPAIKRGPTDMLKALSGTVGVDTTAPHFAFIDDPATIPSTTEAKRNYYMAKEMGARAARQLAAEWPTLFAFDRDEPRLPVFRPENVADPMQVEPTEANLVSMMEARQVRDAAMLYERIRAEDKAVSEKVQMDLFRLCAYYNNADPPMAEMADWHGLRNYGMDEETKWQQAGLADLLFETLPKTPETKSIMICGLLKHGSEDSKARAHKMYKEMKEANEAVSIEAVAAIVRTCGKFYDACAILKKHDLAKPTRLICDALLHVIAKEKGSWEKRLEATRRVLGEMEASGIQPVLATFNEVLSVVTPPRAAPASDANRNADKADDDKKLSTAVSWLSEMLEHLELRTEITPETSGDSQFFLSAMQVAVSAADLQMAERVRALYLKSNNNVKLPAFTLESMFFNRYLLLVVEKQASLEVVEKTYKEHVPRLVGVSRALVNSVCERMKVMSSWSLVLRVIEDGMAARQMIDLRIGSNFRQLLLDVQQESLSPLEREQYSKLIRRLTDVWEELAGFTDERVRKMQIKLNPSTVSECALLLMRVGEQTRAWKMLDLLLDREATHGEKSTVAPVGYAKISVLQELLEEAIRSGDAAACGTVIEIMSNQLNRAKLEPFAQRVIDRVSMTPAQKRILSGFVRLRPQ